LTTTTEPTDRPHQIGRATVIHQSVTSATSPRQAIFNDRREESGLAVARENIHIQIGSIWALRMAHVTEHAEHGATAAESQMGADHQAYLQNLVSSYRSTGGVCLGDLRECMALVGWLDLDLTIPPAFS
jgi:hypothetical protein